MNGWERFHIFAWSIVGSLVGYALSQLAIALADWRSNRNRMGKLYTFKARRRVPW